VTLEEALAELGLEPGADPETVRRSYLRLIKSRKPESDPMGFKRARLAYEIARAESQLQAFAVQVERRYEAPLAPAPPAADDAPPAAVGFDAFVTAWQAAPALDRFKKLAIAREAVAALPGDPRAHWLVVTSLSGFMGDAQIAQALRDGYRAGFEEFLEALLIRVPDRATRAEVNAALASGTPSLRLLGAAVGAGRDSERSAALLIEMCAQAEASDPARLPTGAALDVILALHEAEAVESAIRAHKAVRQFLRESGLELHVLSGDLAVIWTLAEELASLPVDFPIELRRAFAAASRAGDLHGAFYEAYDAVRRDRVGVARWTDRLSGAANIADVLRAAFAYDADRRRSEVRSGLFRGAGLSLLVVAAIVIVRGISSSSSGSRYDPTKPVLTVLPSPQIRPGGPEIDLALQAGAELCAASRNAGGRLSCDDVQEMLAALGDSRCDTTGRMFQDLTKQLGGRPASEREARVLTRIEAARRRICSSGPEVVP
jgi:hypothetical protein